MSLNKKQKLILLVLLSMIAMLITFGAILGQNGKGFSNNTTETDGIMISAESGFYNKKLTVYISADSSNEIYYTLDGSDPDKENVQSKIVTKDGIIFECGEIEQPYNLKCRAYYSNGTTSEIVCRSYIVGENIDERYDIPVLNVYGVPYDFYNYENGIMTHGKLDDEYVKANPHHAVFLEQNLMPAWGNLYQTGRESEKPVYMTLFDEKGEILLAQKCGFRLFGGSSRTKNQPSFRLYARSEYDIENDFDYLFFGNQYDAENTFLIDKYQRISIRNSGNDNGYANIRSELCSALALDMGGIDAQASAPVCVYLNGEYYGVHWFTTHYDDEYFKQKYGDYTGEVFVLEGRSNELNLQDEEYTPLETNLRSEYDQQIAYFSECDLSEDNNWEKLNQFMDVDNFLQYMAIINYISNDDSLDNNFKVYRYYTEDGEYRDGTIFDGRYRFLLFDLDYSFGYLGGDNLYESYVLSLTAERVLEPTPQSLFFANLVSRSDCKDKYIKYFLSCMNYYYSEDYVIPRLNELHAERYKELENSINRGLYIDNFISGDTTSMDIVESHIEKIREYSRKRPGYAFKDLIRAFGAMTPYSLNLSNASGSIVQIDYAQVSMQEFSGIYLVEVPPVLIAKPKLGEVFAYWLVNGKQINEQELVIEEYMIQDYVVDVECVCVPDPNAGLRISAVKAKGGEDYIEITNFGQNSVNLASYTLSDSDGKRVSTLPTIWLEPSQSQTLYCKNYTKFEALGQPGVNFNLKAGETVTLYHDEEVIDRVVIPGLGSDDSVFRLNINTGEYQEKIE